MHNLTKKNYFAYAMQMYDNPSCSGIAEFQQDLLRVKYVKRLINRYTRTGNISTRLLLNHLIAIYNVFQAPAVARLLFFRTDPCTWSAMKTALEFVNLMPEELPPVDGISLLNRDIPSDTVLLDKLTELVDGHG